MYTVYQKRIKNIDSWSYRYCEERAILAWHLYNTALFRIRQVFTGWEKESRTLNEQEVFMEVSLLEASYPSIHIKKVISYSHLEKLMRVTNNPDFFSGLPMQTAQAVLKQAVQDFKNWLAALRVYKKNPSSFTGKPKMPHYKKAPCTFLITNQDAVLYGEELKLPGIKERLQIRDIPEDSTLKEVKVMPFYVQYTISLTLEYAYEPSKSDGSHFASIDFGVDNFASLVATDGSSAIYKGGAVLSENQWFAKSRAKAVGIITKGHTHLHAASRHINRLSIHHEDFIKDQLHKISHSIISFCKEHKVSVLVLGQNKLWKQRTGIGDSNNQKFVQMPIKRLIQMIEYKAVMAGIAVVYQEESYTSKASFVDGDCIPVYGKNDHNAVFSGTRIKRGLYKCGNGEVINADLNGAANILRKAFPYAWNHRACMSVFSDFSFLKNPEVFGFHELNPKGIPVKRIMGA